MGRKLLIGTAITAAALGALTAYAIAPAKASKEKAAPFKNKYFAHRGLHSGDGNTPENSLAAFKAAAEKGFGIELDVHLTTDNEVIVFHDDDLKRMCGVDRATFDLSYDEIKELSLLNTEHKIPLFTEVLKVYNGAGPMVLEIKTCPRKYELCEKVLELLNDYEGDVCIESFDPRIVGWWKKNAPQYLRGQLAQQYKKYDGQPKILAFMLANSLTNFIARPHFIAYNLGKKPLLTRLSEKMGALKFNWTVRSKEEEAKVDGIIFEKYEPESTDFASDNEK
ncbi:MAG: glycerophosphodiester phosphodiesterase [Clostridia bacterium]|nr:glycerophosphodiester phosphodiesterase [Clostridia bacterium]